MQTVFWKWPGKVSVFAKKVGLEEASRSLVRHRLFVHFPLLLVHMYRLKREVVQFCPGSAMKMSDCVSKINKKLIKSLTH